MSSDAGPCIVILAAPSGSGKTSIAKNLMAAIPGMFFSVSATTRRPRAHEKDGVHYHFMSARSFREAIGRNQLLEYEEVYPNCFYGTLRSEIERSSSNNAILLDVDVVGAISVKKQYKDRCLALFVKPPSIEELERRLLERGTETEESLAARLGKAKHELSFESAFDHVVVNDNLSAAIEETISLVSEFVSSC